MKLVYIGMRMKDKLKKGKVFLMPEVEEFLSLIQYASYVITDSFHGTAFSINFNREVIDIYPNEFSTRLSSILKWAGISCRHLESFDDFEIANEKIDYVTVHGDDRGYFMETYNLNDMKEAGLDMNFVQDNQSMSTKGVLRGLHFQKQYPQGKLVRAIKGRVFDVAVDLRSDSKTYGQWYGVELTEENKKQFYIQSLTM